MTAASGATSTASKAAMPNIEEPASAAAVTALYAVEPGPLAGSSVVRFSLARAGQVVIEVYNVRGQRVRALTKDILAAGEHVLDWQGDDERGSPVASGTYIVRMEALAGC